MRQRSVAIATGTVHTQRRHRGYDLGFSGDPGGRDINEGHMASSQLHGPNQAFFNINLKTSETMESTAMFVDRKAYGIPFLVDEQRVMDAAMNHHGTAVHVNSVERLMLPFWLGATSAGGSFTADVLQDDTTTLSCHVPTWNVTHPYHFTYPYEDHHLMNQVSASYMFAPTFIEKALANRDIPSMLISRFELREELETMKAVPRLIPFDMSSKSLVATLEKRLTKEVVEEMAKKELRKYHGNYYRANVRFLGLVFECMRIKPIFLPCYHLSVTTTSNSAPVPLIVCGATGKCHGPVIHSTTRKKVFMSGAAGLTALVGAAAIGDPTFAATTAMFAGGATYAGMNHLAAGETLRKLTAYQLELNATATINHATDRTGYKWSVEDEEAMEYSMREELRAKARKRMAFEQRVREEATREEAERETQSTRHARRRARPGLVNSDPLDYYKVVGLTGKEATATTKEIAKAFRTEAQRCHPDVAAPEDEEMAKQKMQTLVEAYNILRDPKLRKEYDTGALTERSL
jgi:hypothetical protein